MLDLINLNAAKARKLLIYSDWSGFGIACLTAFAQGWTSGEVVWGLLISSMVAGPLSMVLPLWLLLLNPELEKKLFPNEKAPDFSPAGRIATGILITVIFAGPFLMFMLMFVGFLVERAPVEGMPASDALWIWHSLWAVTAHWQLVLVVTVSKLFESTIRIFRGDGTAFVRPWALVVKMFVMVFMANFGFGRWMLVPFIALVYVPEGTIMRWLGGKNWAHG